MKNSEQSSEKQLALPKWLIFSFIAVSFIGFIDSSYLTVSHYSGIGVNCTLTEGCGEVTTSEYSKVFGIPLALIGMLYYLTMLIGALLYFDTKNEKIIEVLRIFVWGGLLGSIYFVYLQLVVIQAICEYCMLSAVTSTLLFIFGLLTFKYIKPYSNSSQL